MKWSFKVTENENSQVKYDRIVHMCSNWVYVLSYISITTYSWGQETLFCPWNDNVLMFLSHWLIIHDCHSCNKTLDHTTSLSYSKCPVALKKTNNLNASDAWLKGLVHHKNKNTSNKSNRYIKKKKKNLREDVFCQSVCHNKHQSSSPRSSHVLKQDRTTTGGCGFGKQLQTGEDPV